MTTTTVAKPGVTYTPPAAAAPRSRTARRLTLALLILTVAAIAIGTWLIVARVAGGSANPVSAAAPVSAWTPIASPWLERLEVIHLKNQLVRAGYGIKVGGTLDPITKSALADYLQLDATHPLSPFLAGALDGTVITGFRNPAAWNSRFGLHRLTKFVERPLTGPDGQLDANGNLRAPVAAIPSRPRAKAAAPKNAEIAFVDPTETLDVINPKPKNAVKPQDAVFQSITADDIVQIRNEINGSANAHNQITAGTVLVYRTSAGNNGKMQVLKYGYNLRIRWVTYRPNGTILSNGNNLLIKGTYAYDLDRGRVTTGLHPNADFWWEQEDAVLRRLVFENGASFTIASYHPCEFRRAGVGVSPCAQRG